MKLDPEFVLEQVSKAPSSFEMQARNADRKLHIGGRNMVFLPVYGCPFTREAGQRREATMDDMSGS